MSYLNETVDRDTELKTLALAVARNRVGAQVPLDELLAAEHVAPEQFAEYMKDPVFVRYIKQFALELQENGFSFRAKSRVAAEDLIKVAYKIVTDDETPAAVRMKGIENFVSWGDLAPKPASSQTGNSENGPGIVINIAPPAGYNAQIGTTTLTATQIPATIKQSSHAVDDMIAMEANLPVEVEIDALFNDDGYEQDPHTDEAA